MFNGGDTNLYRYVGGDPINFIDPTGLDRSRLVAKIVRLTEKGMDVLSDWLDWDDALRAAQEGEDLIARNRNTAKELGDVCGGGRAEHHPAHKRTAGPDARPHYHPNDMDNHIFYQMMMFFDFDGSGDIGWNDAAEGYDMFGPGPMIYLPPGSDGGA